MKKACIISVLLIAVLQAFSQEISSDILTREWNARWITVPEASPDGYGVYLFRKTIDLPVVPATFIIHVSADNRYKLYINGKLASLGPARGDMYYWNFETVDLARYLQPGINTIAAKVWNEGRLRPEAQISWQTGFILQGNAGAECMVNTNESWKCTIDSSYAPFTKNDAIGYYVAGPGEFKDMRKSMTGWIRSEFNDAAWQKARLAFWRGGSPKGLSDAFGWMLVPSPIPPMELTSERLQSTRESSGVTVPDGFPAMAVPVTIPPNTHATLLLDQGYLTNAYLNMLFSNGKDASITLKYAEALFVPAHSELYGTTSGGYMGRDNINGKGNRNEVKGKIFLGRKDSLVSDGTLHQEFTTLYWRTFRYILLTIDTKDDALMIDNIYGTFTGYPFQRLAGFESDNPALQKILDIGWRTARLCALETYMDCPYYEQLQYIGDTRIQALISLYNSGDERLVKNAINLMDHSRIAEGVTLSRHPSFSPQIIPTFSLWYIGMLHDFWMYRPDSQFVKEKIGGTRQILGFFNRYQQTDGSLRNVPYWNFTDWVENRPGWRGGVAPAGKDGSSGILDLQLLLAYQVAAELEENLGMKAMADEYNHRGTILANTIRARYWDEQKGLFADTPEKDKFSQHANSLAILANLFNEQQAGEAARKMLTDKTLTEASIYFKYYYHLALVKAGMGNDYLTWLDKWHENIAMGMTTWAEDSDINTARSDCHAWGSSPNIEFFRIVLGIDTDAPGFQKVRISPHPGDLKKVSGSVPHPFGNISVKYTIDKEKFFADILLPPGLQGTFVWKGKEYVLNEGQNKLEL